MLSQSLGERAEAAVQHEANRLTEIYGVEHTEQCIEMARMKQKSAVHFHMAVVLAERAKRVEEAMLEGMDTLEGPGAKPTPQSCMGDPSTAAAAQADSLDQRVSRTRAKWSLFTNPTKPKQNESDSEEAASREEAESLGIVPSLTYSHFIAQQTQARERREREKAEADARKKLVSNDTTTDPLQPNAKEGDARTDCAWEQMQEELAELIANAAIASFQDNQPPTSSAFSTTAHDSPHSVFFASAAQESQPDIPIRNSSLNRLSSYMLADLDTASYAVESPSSAKKASFIPHKIQTRLSADDIHAAFVNQSKAPSNPAPAVAHSETTNSTPQIISAADTITTISSDHAIHPSITPSINPLISTLPLTHGPEVKSVVALHRKASKISTTSTTTSSKGLRRSNSMGAISISAPNAAPSVSNPGVAHPPAMQISQPPVFLQPQQVYPLPYQQQQQKQQQKKQQYESNPQTHHLMAAIRLQQSTPSYIFPQPQLQPPQRQIHSNPQIPSHITYSNAPASIGRSDSIMTKKIYSSSSTTTQQQQQKQQQKQVVEYEVVDIGFGSASKQGQGGTSSTSDVASGRAFTNKKPSLVSSLRKGFW
ncbi:hypothetical protein BJ741DRAFT_621047 [Chytriomyces cf. hyalinus JEL632]|nr:hypothetical protein BJ741DRAFT_621047 [Chytriomyces cf. hyalinus JEL632]